MQVSLNINNDMQEESYQSYSYPNVSMQMKLANKIVLGNYKCLYCF